MQAYLVCDDEMFGRSIRQVMVREGVDCPSSGQIDYAQAARRLAAQPAELVIAVLPDDPVRSIEALEVLGAAPRRKETLVVAIGPAADSKLVIRALRGVVDDYLDIDDVETELVATLAAWRQRGSAGRPEGRLVAVLGPNGGAGSSLIASGLAASLAKEHGSAALVDLKLESGDQAALFDLKPAYTLADISQHIDRLDRSFFEKAMVKHACGVNLLSPPSLLADVEAVTPEGIRQSIGFSKALFPFVVADLDHGFREEQMVALRQADLILVVFRLDFTSLRNVRRAVDHLDGLGIAKDRLRLVVNRWGQAGEVPRAKAEGALQREIFHLVPEDPKPVNQAINHGVPVVLDAPRSKVARSLIKLASNLFDPRTQPPAAEPAPAATPSRGLFGRARKGSIPEGREVGAGAAGPRPGGGGRLS